MRKKVILIIVSIGVSILIFIGILLLNQKESKYVKLYINDPKVYKSPVANSDSIIGKKLLELIEEADEKIDFAIYGLRNQEDILEALIEAHKRGVVVRGIVDKNIYDENYYDDTKRLIEIFPTINNDYETDMKTLNEDRDYDYNQFWPNPKGFEGAGQCVGYSLKNNKAIIGVHASKDKFEFTGDIMHNKFFVIDGMKVWTGSTNISGTGTGGYNANISCVIENKIIAGWFVEEFNQMYKEKKFHGEKSRIHQNKSIVLDNNTEVKCFFSPQDNAVEEGVIPLIRGAKKSINITVFFLTHKGIAGELIKAYNRGVDVRIILDATGATNGYTKHEILRAVGIPIKVENWGGKMHMKAASFDDEYTVFGSMNWTSAGDMSNDENTIVLKNSYYVRQFNENFEDMWNSIPDKYLKANPSAESIDSINSLSDGIDNDFDDLIDGKDQRNPEKAFLPPFKIVPKEEGYNLIKGIINKNGYKIYVLPNNKYYNKYKVDKMGEGYYPSITEAMDAGFEKFNYSKHVKK